MKHVLLRQPRYFVRIDAHKMAQFRNVAFIETSDERKWERVVEQELHTGVDLFHGPLWRLSVVHNVLEPSKCTFVFFMHHVLTDGRNHCIFIELLNIVGALLEGRECAEMSEQAIESAHGLCHYVNAFVKEHSADVVGQQLDVKLDQPVRMPQALGHRVSGNECDFWHLNVAARVLAQLLARMKERTRGGAKLTGLVQTVFCSVYKRMLCKYGETELASQPFTCLIPCTGRGKFNIGDVQMGDYSLVLPSRVPSDQLTGDLDSIWSVAEAQTRSLHDRIKRHQEVATVCSFLAAMEAAKKSKRDETIPLDDLIEGTCSSSMPIVISLSNTGRLVETQSAAIKVSELYCAMPSFLRHCNHGKFFLFVNTVNDNLCLTFSYNERLFSKQFMTEFRQEMSDLIEQLAESSTGGVV